MAKVPYKSVTSVAGQDTAIPSYHSSAASAAAFGSLQGKAMEGLGDAISKAGDVFTEHALKQQNLDNEAASKDILLSADVALGKATVEYNSLEGKNKVDAYPGFVSQIEGIKADHLQAAGSNPAVRRMFDNSFTPRMATSIVQGAGQAATAQKTWRNETSEARVNTAVSDTAANWQDDNRFGQNMAIVHQEVDFQGRDKGWSPEKIEQEKLDKSSSLWSARISSMARSDPFAARQLFEANKSNIGGMQQINIDKALNEQDVNVGTRILSDQIIGGQQDPKLPEPPKPYMPPAKAAPDVRGNLVPPGKIGALPEQKDRPDQYSGRLYIGGQDFTFATGGGKTPSIPYGTYQITPEANGPFVSSVGGFTLNGNSLYDPKLGRDRLGIAIHPASGSGQVSAGCIVIPDEKWPAFKAELQRRIATEGPQYVTVNPDGGAFISSKPGEIGARSANANYDMTPPNPADKSQPVAVRMNNPGNQWMGESAKKFGATQSADISDRDKPAVFPDRVSGAAAMFDLLGSSKYSGQTVQEAIFKWAGGRNPAYPEYIEKQTGISPDTVITKEFLQSDQGIKLTKAMSRYEAGHERGEYPLSEQGWQTARERALGKADSAALPPNSKVASLDPTSGLPAEAPTKVPGTEEPLVKVAENPEATGKDVLPPLSADSGSDWLEKALDRGRDWARQVAPNNPKFEDTLLARIETEYNRVKRVRSQAETQNYNTIMTAVMGDFGEKMVRSPDAILSNPQLNDAFGRLPPPKQLAIQNQIKKNAAADVPLTPERYGRFQEIMGMRVTDPSKFAEVVPGEQDIPRTLQSQIFTAQRQNAGKLQDTTRVNAALRTVGPMLGEAGVIPDRSDEGKMATYNQFVGAFDVKLKEWETEKKKFPSEAEQRQIAAGLLTEVEKNWFTANRRAFEPPSSWPGPDGKSYTIDEWKEKFKQRMNRNPAPDELFQIYQRSQKQNGQ